MASRRPRVELEPAAESPAFPAYAHVPGQRPHPTRHPQGHSYGRHPERPLRALRPDDWRSCPRYLEGVELFEHGYYWEAHEAWEDLWIAAERTGAVGELLQGLIMLAAAGVKIRQGRGAGAATLGGRARQCFARARQQHGSERLAGLALDELLAFAEHVQAEGPRLPGSPDADVEVVFERRLPLEGREASEP